MEVKGSIQGHFSEATKLQNLVVSTNALEGGIPEELPSQNPLLEKLILSRNNLNGTVPTSIGSLVFLKELGLDGNNLTGPIVDEHFASLNNLRK